jgi:glycosyltransferase involved in cell wall biosynthesis
MDSARARPRRSGGSVMHGISDLNVCFLAGTLDRGGAEQQLFYMLKALRASGVNPRLLCLQSGGYWETMIRKLDVPITCVGGDRSRLKRFLRIARELRNTRPDIFQSQHFYTNAYVGAAGRLLRIPAIGAMRSNGESEVRACGKFLGEASLRLPELLAANSRAALEYARSRGVSPERLYFLPNVVDTEQFRPTGHERGDGVIKLLCAGRLVREKRFDLFLDVLARVRRAAKHPVRGMVVTSNARSSDLRELKQQAAQLGLIPQGVEFLEGSTNMASVYQTSDICVLTSDFEGTPNVLLEAMACSLPVVATRVGGVPQLVTHGETGLLADREDEEGICSALLAVIGDPALRQKIGERARRHVEVSYSIGRLTAALVSLYRVSLKKRRSRKNATLEESCA